MNGGGRLSQPEATTLALLLLLSGGGCGRKPPVVHHPLPQPPPETRPAPPSPATTAPPAETRRDTPGPAPVPEPEGGGPPIRIGLTTSALEARITAPGEFFLVERIPEAPRRALRGEYLVSIERSASTRTDVYRLQVASLSSSEAAERLRRELAERLGLPSFTRENPSTGTTQVRLGEFATRAQARSYGASVLAEAGYPDFLVVSDVAERSTGEARIAMRGPERFLRAGSTGFFFFPASRSEFLRLDGRPYRGLLELSLNRNSRMTIVNQLGIEDYLLGVVPAEISPATYPEPAALAAQSVAARTYALRNSGRFSAEGFDLTADTRTQVYGGVAQERELTNQAVQSTRGLALYYQGELINAMYSSTCGGRTEDFSNVFDASPVPYLTSVFCAAEIGPTDSAAPSLRGRHTLEGTLTADDGSVANRNLELAEVLGIIEPARLTDLRLLEPPTPEEVRLWVRRARSLAGSQPPAEPKPPDAPVSRAGFLEYATLAYFGPETVRQRISASDRSYYLANLKDGSAVPESAAAALAFLMQRGLWRSYPDNSARLSEPIRRADTLSILIRWIESTRNDLLTSAAFSGFSEEGSGNGPGARSISVKRGNRTQLLGLSSDLRLFRVADSRSLPADELRVIGNERITFRTGPHGAIDFLEVELNPSGAASDRYSPQSSWVSELTRQAVTEKLRRLAPAVGEVLDLAPARLGSSGRAVRILVTGSKGSAELNGYRVRNALGLRDTLFTISRTYGAERTVEKFTFMGRGWGHGVGLCQVGAYGMARSGVAYEDILKTFYKGAEIRKAF